MSARLRLACLPLAASLLAATIGHGQSTPPRTRADSLKADSARIADSLAVVRELGAQRPAATQGQTGPINARLLPDISLVGDMISDLSPKGSTVEGGNRFGIREVEFAAQAAVDPYFRGDVFIGFSDAEGVAIEQAFLTTTSFPWQLELRLGRFLMPVGKQNTTHRHDLHSIEYPLVLQRFLGEEGLKGTGLQASKVVAPFGFYQELIVSVVDRFGEAPEDLASPEPANKDLTGLGFSARLRNYWDLSESSNVELAASTVTGRREQPVALVLSEFNATNARQSVYGVDVTYRWRPLQQGLYKSFILQGEFLRQVNERTPSLAGLPGSPTLQDYLGPNRDFNGLYAFTRWQMSRRTYIGGRLDALEDPEFDGGTTRAASLYFTFFPSEFSKLVAAYERIMPPSGFERLNRLLVQASFSLGPHKPHPF
jgi:hypothetical protein